MSLKGLKIVTKANGRTFTYFRAPGGALTRLPDLPHDDAGFLAAYAKAAQDAQREGTKKAAAARTLSDLALLYFKSRSFLEMAESSRRTRRRIVEKIVAKGGHVAVRAIERKHVQRDIDKCSKGATHGRLNAWRALFKVAVREDWVKADPTAAAEKARYEAESHDRWEPDEIEAFRVRWPLASPQRTAFELLYWTGCRRSDVVCLGWQHVEEGWLVFRQVKTKGLVEMPIAGRLADALAHCPRDRLTFLQTDSGRGRSAKGFGNWFREACDAAGVTKSAHGLRHDMGASTAELGFDGLHAAAILGHRNEGESEVYRRSTRRRKLAEEAMARLEEERDVRNRPGNHRGNSAEKARKS